MINRPSMENIGMDAPKCTGAIVIAAVLILAALRYTFEGTR